MKSSRYSPEQVAFAMRQAESGTPVPEICCKMGIAEQTFYRWKKKYAGMGVAILRSLDATGQVSQGPIFKQDQIARAAALGLGVTNPEQIKIVTRDNESEDFASTIRKILYKG
jgi:transposase-like protein